MTWSRPAKRVTGQDVREAVLKFPPRPTFGQRRPSPPPVSDAPTFAPTHYTPDIGGRAVCGAPLRYPNGVATDLALVGCERCLAQIAEVP